MHVHDVTSLLNIYSRLRLSFDRSLDYVFRGWKWYVYNESTASQMLIEGDESLSKDPDSNCDLAHYGCASSEDCKV